MREKFIKRIKNMNFGRQVMLCIVPVVMLTYFASAFTFTVIMQHCLRADAINSMRDVTDRTRYYIESHLNSMNNLFYNFESNAALYNLKVGMDRNWTINQMAQYYVDLDILLKGIMASNQNCLESVYINFNDGELLVQKFSQSDVNVHYSYEKWRERYPKSDIYFRMLQEEPDVTGNDVAAIVFRLYQSGELNGIIMFTIKSSFFKELLGEISVYTDSAFCILTENGEQFQLKNYADKEILSDEIVSQILSSSDEVILTSGGQYVYSVPISNTGWRLALQVPVESVMSDAVVLLKNYVAIAAFATISLCLVVGFSARFVSMPLRTLTDRVIKMKNQNLDAEFDVDGCREINILNTELSRMHDYSMELMEQIKREKDLKRKAELQMLQEQIKPHFLYNSLYSIQQLCETGDTEQASKMLRALSGFYRLGISSGSDVITIQKELEHVDDYLQIQKMRYSDRFDYIIDCDTVICQYEIPKLVLQPLVENAIYHGIRQSKKKGFISITGGLDGNDIVLEVHDDGTGIDAIRLEEIRRSLRLENDSGGIGLKNVDFRIKKTYGEGYGIEISSEQDVDTCVCIRLARYIHE